MEAKDVNPLVEIIKVSKYGKRTHKSKSLHTNLPCSHIEDLSLHLLPPRMCIGKKLESEA